MGYLSILIALLAGTTKGFFGKKISGVATTQRQSILVNTVRMGICVVISLVVLLFDGNFYLDASAWVFGTIAGVTVSMFMVTWLLAVQQGAFMLISVSQMFGVVVTLVCALIVFCDPITPPQILAIFILIAAVLFMGSYSTSLKGKLSIKAIVLLVLCGFSSGLYDFSLKLFTYYSESSVSMLNLISYAVAACLLGLVLLLPHKEASVGGKELLRSTWLPLIIMSVCLFLNSYFKALANNDLSPTQVYPIYQAGGLIFSAAMSAIFFHEKITPKCVFGMLLAFIAILLLK